MSTPIAPVTCGSGRAFKYQFDLEVQRVSLQLTVPCFVQVSWRRGNKSIQTKNRIELHGREKYFDVGERMSMISTCYLDDTVHRFSEKNSMVNIILFIGNVPKSGGCCPLDLSQVLNPFNHKECLSKVLELPLVKCPIKNSKIELVLHGTYLQEMVQDDRSIGSGISSALNYSDSNFSMSFHRRTFEPASRDSSSVHNGAATTPANPASELTRYGSNKRIDENITREQVKRKVMDPIGPATREQVKRKVMDPIGPASYFTSPLSSITENMADSQQRINQQRQQRIEETYQLSSAPQQRESVSFRDEGFVSVQPLSNSNKLHQSKEKDDRTREQKFRLETENTQLKIFVQEQSKKMNQILSECSSAKQESRMHQYTAERKSDQARLLEEELNLIRAQLAQSMETSNAEIGRLTAKANDLQTHLSNQMRELEAKLKEREEMRSQYDGYRQQAEGLARRLQEQCRSYQQQNAQRQKDCDSLKAAAEASQREAEGLMAQLGRLQQNRSEEERSIVNDLRSQLKAEEQRTADGQRRLRSKQKELEEKESQLRSLTTRLIDCEKQLARFGEASTQSERIIDQLKLSLSDSNRRGEQATAHLHGKSKELEGCRRNNSELALQKGLLQKELSGVKLELEGRSAQMASQERELIAKIAEVEARLILQSRSSEQTTNALRREIDCRQRSWRLSADDYTRTIAELKGVLERQETDQRLGLEEISTKLAARESECCSLLNSNNELRTETARLANDLSHSRQEISRLVELNKKSGAVVKQYEYSRAECDSLREQLAGLNSYLEQKDALFNAKDRELDQSKTRIRALCQQIQHLLIQNEEMQSRLRHLQETELSQHLKTIGMLKQDLERVQSHLSDVQASQVNFKDASANQLNSLMKENIQLQVALKVRQEQAKKHQALEREVNTLRNKIEFEGTHGKELEEQLSRVESELKEKSRAAIIECEKAKMYLEERNNFAAMYTEKSVALQIEHDKCEVLDRNLRELEVRYEEEQARSRQLESSLRGLTCETARRDRHEEVRSLERRVRELEARDAQKITTIEQLTRNLCKSNDVIKDLHRASEQKSKEFAGKERVVQELEQKLIAAEEQRRRIGSASNEQQVLSEKRTLQRKNELLMNELCSLKQRLEEQLRQPTNTSDLSHRVTSLQNQLFRKDEKLKKLERENSKLEEENIQLNIRIMKELTEIQKKQEGIKSEYGKSLGRVLSDSHNS